MLASRCRLPSSRRLLATFPSGSFRFTFADQQRVMPRRDLSVRAGRDKSWKEIISDAASLASTALSKVATGISSIGQSISGSPTTPHERSERPMATTRPSPAAGSSPLTSSPLNNPLANLVGRAVGGLVAGVVDQIGKQLESAAEETEGVYARASAAVKGSVRVQSLLGGRVECGQVTTQSLSSTNINGATSSSVNLSFQVYSSSGRVAQARVTSDGQKMGIKLFLQDGTILDVTAAEEGQGSIGGSAEIIEAEFRDLPSKK